MLVCLLWDFDSANLLSGCRRGERFEGCEYESIAEDLFAKPAGNGSFEGEY